ncbi:MAG: COX aromatic rich motif-containing protein [Oligoflexia bacterium]|nr:COX aromatic rich motif-containing protein [Oligoflexia bacterium]
MKRIKSIIGPLTIILAILLSVLAIFFVLKNDNTLLIHPKGPIAREEFHLMITNILHMLIIIGPTYILLFMVVWKYRAKNLKAETEYDPEKSIGIFGQLIFWTVPSIIVASMAIITWNATHELDPYRPLKSDITPIRIQVVALNWKWLFIYPQQGIATVNFVQFPQSTPVHFSLAADGAPMNSFWIPQLAGQINSMAGMVTPLYVMADGPGVYAGRVAEINGPGYSDMTFVAKSTSKSDFDSWVTSVKQSPHQLTDRTYNELFTPSENNPVTLYSYVEKDLFNKIVLKYMPYMHSNSNNNSKNKSNNNKMDHHHMDHPMDHTMDHPMNHHMDSQ